MVYAKPTVRLVAIGLDVCILAAASTVLAAAVLLLKPPGIPLRRIDSTAIALALTAAVGYFAMFESSIWKGTPGKRLMGLRVTALRGNRLTRFQCLVRAILFTGSIMLAGLPLLFAFKNKKRQAGHDLFAQSVVLQKKEDSPAVGKFKLVLPWVAAGCAIGASAVTLALWSGTGESSLPGQSSSLKMASGLRTGVEITLPMRRYIEAQMGPAGRQPDRLPDGVREQVGVVAGMNTFYDSRTGSIHLHLVGGSRRITLLLAPERKANGAVVWRCGASGIELGELPDFCEHKD